jgi:photosystem II stability/assembly factor-like uncharacterized protein
MKMKKKLSLFILLIFFAIFAGATCRRTPATLGIFKSDDEGITWQQKVKIDKKKTIKDVEVLSIKIDPTNSKTIYIGTKEKGVYKSTDGAEAWQQTSLKVGDVYAIDIDPKNTNTIYAAGYFGTLGKIYKSNNGGEKFEEIYSETHEKTQVLSLGVDSYDPRKIYAGTKAGALLKSEDSGRSWVVKQWLNNDVVEIAISPRDTRHILVGTRSDGIYETKNGGQKWVKLDEALSRFAKAKNVHSLIFSPKVFGTVYLGSSFGLLKSEDDGKTWKSISLLVEPGEASIIKVALDPQDPQKIYLGLDSTIYKSSDGGKSWTVKKITSGLIQAIACDPQEPKVIYVGIKKATK